MCMVNVEERWKINYLNHINIHRMERKNKMLTINARIIDDNSINYLPSSLFSKSLCISFTMKIQHFYNLEGSYFLERKKINPSKPVWGPKY